MTSTETGQAMMFCVVEKRVDSPGPLSVYATKPAPSLVLLPMIRGCDFVSKYYRKSTKGYAYDLCN